MRPRRHRIGFADLLDEATRAVGDQTSRFVLTALGTVLGVASLVATVGVAQSAGNQIAARFDEASGTEVVVEVIGSDDLDGQTEWPIPWSAQDLLERLNGVEYAGTLTSVDSATRSISAVDLGTGSNTGRQLPVFAMSPGALLATGADIAGTGLDPLHTTRTSAVAILGRGAASELGVSRLASLPTIFIDEEPLLVIGIVEDLASQPQLLEAVLVTDQFARTHLGLTRPESVVVKTSPGAAQLIGAQAPFALAPHAVEKLRVRIPPQSEALRSQVGADVNALFVLVGLISLAVGAIGIANSTLVAVRERTTELGIRRSLGATRADIAAIVTAEAVMTGLIAGVVGAAIGTLAVVGVAVWSDWTPVLELWVPLAAPIVGAVVGLVAGAYPAWRAALVEPISALRST